MCSSKEIYKFNDALQKQLNRVFIFTISGFFLNVFMLQSLDKIIGMCSSFQALGRRSR